MRYIILLYLLIFSSRLGAQEKMKNYDTYYYFKLVESTNDLDKKISLLSILIEDNIYDDKAYFIRGKVYFARQEYSKAISDFEKAKRIASNEKEYLLWQIFVKIRLGELKNVGVEIERVKKENFNSLFLYTVCGAYYTKIGDYESALYEFNKALYKEREFYALVENGRLEYLKNNYSSSIKYFSEALKLNFYDNECVLLLGKAQSALHNEELAIVSFEKYASMSVKSSELYLAWIKSLINVKKFNSAIELANDAIRNNINEPLIYNYRGKCQYELGNYEISIADFNKAVTLAKFSDIVFQFESYKYKDDAELYIKKNNSNPIRENGDTDLNGHERKLALILGNQSYIKGPLKNTISDANLMEITLKNLGFEVFKYLDCDQKKLKRAILDFGSRLDKDAVALVFYSGHGIEVNRKNYLIPIDAEINKESDTDIECVSMESIIDQLASAECSKSIIILDACRVNPFAMSWGKSGTNRSIGLLGPGYDVTVLYATTPGNIASDGSGVNGLFTDCLVRNMKVSGIDLFEIMTRTKDDVVRRSNGQQKPYMEGTPFRFKFIK